MKPPSATVKMVQTLQACMFVLSFSVGALAFQDTLPASFVDNVLAVTLPRYAKDLEELHLDNFNFKVMKTGITNRDLKAEFHDGRLSGLSTTPGLRRVGDCAPVRQGSNVLLGCYVSLEALKVAYNGSARGDTFIGTNKTVHIEATFPQSKGFIEVMRMPGAPPALKSWNVLPLNIHLSFSLTLDLNSERQRRYEDEVRKHVEEAAMAIFHGPLRDALNQAVRATPQR